MAAFVGFLVAAAPDPARARKEMQKLDWLVGKWEGESWMMSRDGQRQVSRGTEHVRRKVGGLALLVEGHFTSKTGSGEAEATVHEAMGVFSYDAAAGAIRFRTYLANGMGGEHEAKVADDGTIVWGYRVGNGEMRYTTRKGPQGEWIEVGEFSSDGKTWRQVLGMTLKRVDGP